MIQFSIFTMSSQGKPSSSRSSSNCCSLLADQLQVTVEKKDLFIGFPDIENRNHILRHGFLNEVVHLLIDRKPVFAGT